ncbi:rhodanese-like domain-containing protein [Pullulanibacillus sp. KACC 23026]|uniref:rhodanese-like domain-containing protein n=1 Tax=Pullulanibacillus sp. KACC 23026 TaxID=3028315 RepID=UPI0023AECCA5|nr:rhodanese-like domain-containing protein [Pullulanibacillus sp. KACC 23026]WEG13850.1 rhodanese-like domain-containing protein [Pullulanibacillus sp. KACC 23026]
MTEVKTITPQELEGRLESRDQTLQVVDVREDEEVEAGMIPEAIHIRLSEIPERMDELDRSQPLVMVCRSGGRSQRAAEYLASQGFDVYNMVGGMMNWTGEVRS